MAILNQGNSKTRKGEKVGFKTFGIHFAPANLSGRNVCSHASAACAAACLNTAGRGAMSSVQRARIAKTKRFFQDREKFLGELCAEIAKAIKSAEKRGMVPAFRLNLTSDLPWENIHFGASRETIFQWFPSVQFYDYTKVPQRMSAFLAGQLPANYHLTFSRSECNESLALSMIASGGNVAVVFRKTLPASWRGYPVINGDETDLRFLDPKGVIVGLVEKGKAKQDTSGFVVNPQ